MVSGTKSSGKCVRLRFGFITTDIYISSRNVWLQGGWGLDRAKVEQGCVLMI